MEFDIVQENVPSFIRRVGDYTLQGSNNSLIILGTDRANHGPAKIDDGLGHLGSAGGGKLAGAIHLVVGRKDRDGNPDVTQDSSYLYLSMKTDVDTNLDSSFESPDNSLPAVIMKSDAVRVCGRKSVKIFMDGGNNYIHLDGDQCAIKIGNSSIRMSSDKITVDGSNIELGPGAIDRLILGDAFMTFFNAHAHISPVGNTSPPVVPMTDILLSSQTAKVK
jgi:hypothetical protein